MEFGIYNKRRLKLSIQITKIMVSSPITPWQKWKQWQILFSRVPKSQWMAIEARQLKDTCSLEEKL